MENIRIKSRLNENVYEFYAPRYTSKNARRRVGECHMNIKKYLNIILLWIILCYMEHIKLVRRGERENHGAHKVGQKRREVSF